MQTTGTPYRLNRYGQARLASYTPYTVHKIYTTCKTSIIMQLDAQNCAHITHECIPRNAQPITSPYSSSLHAYNSNPSAMLRCFHVLKCMPRISVLFSIYPFSQDTLSMRATSYSLISTVIPFGIPVHLFCSGSSTQGSSFWRWNWVNMAGRYRLQWFRESVTGLPNSNSANINMDIGRLW